MRKEEYDASLQEAFARLANDPLGFVMFLFPWDSDPAIQVVELAPEYQKRFRCKYGPDKWACVFLDRLGQEIKARGFDGTHSVDPIQFSTASGHGIGKSTLVAWLILFIMCCYPLSKTTVTAMTEPQLRARTWAELGKWFRRSLVKHVFVYNTGRGAMSLYHPEYKTEWMSQAVTCREENAQSFAGQHAANAVTAYIFDEASGVPDSIYDVRVGGLTDGLPMTFDFGNPIRNSGYFKENMEGRYANRYIKYFIDSRDVAVTNKAYCQRVIEDFGMDDDRTKVRILGQFPSLGSLQFMPTDLVKEAMAADDIPLDKTAPLTFGVDVARYGDDETVIYPKLGRDARTLPPVRMGDPNNINIANRIIEQIEICRGMNLEYSEIFVDSTGGYGGGVADFLRNAGYHCIEVNFGRTSPDPKYRYVGDCIWGRLRDELSAGLVLPKMGGGIGRTAMISSEDLEVDSGLIEDPLARDMFTQLTGREFSYTTGGEKIHLERKADMKDRLGSPDLVDALALNYALPVRTASFTGSRRTQFAHGHDYDPYSENGK